ncbi:MAG: glycosyltransferase family 4 protein [Lachnospiraceae bacterium]
MNFSQKIINSSEKFRGVLVKVLPMSILRKIKDKLVDRSLEKALKDAGTFKFEKERFPKGVNLIGPIRAEMGLGQSCRLLANELNHTDLDFTINDYVLDGNLRAGDHSWDAKVTDSLEYGVNVMHIEPLDLAFAYEKLGSKTWEGHYNIGFWLWELEEFPENWKKSLALVDEVWTPSEFTSRCIRKVTDKPVFTIPYCVTAPVKEEYDRAYFGIPDDKFLFLVMYDTNSTMARKNPLGAIESFKKAFSPQDTGVGLVLKMNNPRQEDIDTLKASLAEYRNVYYINKTMEKVEVNSLIKCADVFVSLHRAEGFGLVMAEAMLNKTPCIATNWSSNTEFMNEEVACMVDYTFTTLKKTQEPYKKGSRWADANTDTAAEFMKKLAGDREYYNNLAEKGKTYIEEKLGMAQAVRMIEKRIDQIYTVE